MPGIDLHVHSCASDGALAPADVVRRAAALGLHTIALTDHDTLAGVVSARREGAGRGVSVVAGCEFSVAADWGEMHLLAYFLALEAPELNAFLTDQRANRASRAARMVRRLDEVGVAISEDQVRSVAGEGAIGRPHVARALVAAGQVRNVEEAFDRYLGVGRPAYVEKQLPDVARVTTLVRRVGGVTVAAHLKDRGTQAALERLRALGVDGVEVLHPAHDARTRRRLAKAAQRLGLLPSGGSDWHGDQRIDASRGALGCVDVPPAWLEALEHEHRRRVEHAEAKP